MPIIFGHELKGKTMWIILAVIAAGVGLVVYVRSRAAAGSSAGAAPEAGPDTSNMGGGGGGIAVPAPTQQAADNYQAALQQQQLAAGQFNLDYQKQIAGQREQQFNLEQQYRQGTLESQIGLENQINQTAAAHEKQLGKASADFCPAGTSMRFDKNTGQYICRGKSSGGVAGYVDRIITGVLGGVQQAAPNIGYQGANAAAQYYTGQYFPTAQQLPPIAKSAGPSGDQFSLPGYKDMGGGYGVALPVSMMTSGHNNK